MNDHSNNDMLLVFTEELSSSPKGGKTLSPKEEQNTRICIGTSSQQLRSAYSYELLDITHASFCDKPWIITWSMTVALISLVTTALLTTSYMPTPSTTSPSPLSWPRHFSPWSSSSFSYATVIVLIV